MNATARTVAKCEHLKRLKNADRNLTIFEADLTVPGSFMAAIDGCVAVLHTASPFFVGGREYKMQKLLEPALAGTKNVFDTCNQIDSVKKVVLTASTACMYVWYGSKDKDHILTEADWSDEKRIVEEKNWYSHSKVQAERFAWEYSKKGNCTFKLAVMNPCLILGPMLQPVLNTSCAAIHGCANVNEKRSEIENSCKAIVDVRDVARAHVVAMEKDESDAEVWGRRFLLMSACPHWETIHGWVRDAIGSTLSKHAAARVATTVSEKIPNVSFGAPPPNQTKFDNSRSVNVLGLTYTSMEQSVKDNIVSLIEHGFLTDVEAKD